MAWTAPRTWVTGEVVTAANMNTHVRDNLSVLSTAYLIPEHDAGGFYGSQGLQSGTASRSTGTLYAVPFIAPSTVTYDRIVGYLVSGNIRLGIYEDSAGLPGALVLAAAEATSDGSQGIATISQELTGPAKYWLASTISGSGVNMTVASFNSFLQGSNTGVSKAFTYGALPDPFGTATWTTNVPRVELRAS